MNFKRIASIVIGVNLIFSQVAFGASVPTDVLGKSYEAAVTALFEKGIITGDENGKFNPDQTLTRAQACIIVVKSMDAPIPEVAGTATQDALKSGFPDMAGYSWAEGYVRYAVKKGVTKGYPNGTFQPGNKVSSNELITMILRGAGYSDSSLEGIWPSNYKNQAEILSLYTGLPTMTSMPEFATKWMAAQMGYNALPLIKEANKAAPMVAFGVPTVLPNFSGMNFISMGSFDSSISTFGGIPLSDNVQVFTYGQRIDYLAGMVLSTIKSDYRTDSVYKYKRVVTPAQYVLEKNKISSIILPKDVGYTGTIYGVINNTMNGLQTLTAGREINWPIVAGTKGTPDKQTYLSGAVFKLEALNGKIQNIEPMVDLTNGYKPVEEYRMNGPVKLSVSGETEWVQISTTATIYMLDIKNPNPYRVGATASIKEGSQIRLFDLSDDGEIGADLVVIKE